MKLRRVLLLGALVGLLTPAWGQAAAGPATLLGWGASQAQGATRLSLTLSAPRGARLEPGQPGEYRLVLPATVVGRGLSSPANIGQRPLAELLLQPGKGELVVLIRLSDPAELRLQADPQRPVVNVIAQGADGEFPPAEGPGPGRRGPGMGMGPGAGMGPGMGMGPGGGRGPGRMGMGGPGGMMPPRAADAAFGQERVSAQFVSTDLRVILESLIAQSRASILLSPDVEGTYSLILRDVTLEQALDSLAEAFELNWTLLPGDIVLIGPEYELGDRAVEELVRLPAGWTVAEIVPLLANEFPEVSASRALDSLDPTGPLPIRGTLRHVGRARRWVAGLQPKPAGAAPQLPTPDWQSTRHYTRYLTLDDAETRLKAIFPGIDSRQDAEMGFLHISGPRPMLVAALRYLDSVDIEPASAPSEYYEPAPEPAAEPEPAPTEPEPSEPYDDADDW